MCDRDARFVYTQGFTRYSLGEQFNLILKSIKVNETVHTDSDCSRSEKMITFLLLCQNVCR